MVCTAANAAAVTANAANAAAAVWVYKQTGLRLSDCTNFFFNKIK